jgi:hypothetical protein
MFRNIEILKQRWAAIEARAASAMAAFSRP